MKQKTPNLTKHDKRLAPINPLIASLPCLEIARSIRDLASDCLGLAASAFHDKKKNSLYFAERNLLPRSIPTTKLDLQCSDDLKGDKNYFFYSYFYLEINISLCRLQLQGG